MAAQHSRGRRVATAALSLGTLLIGAAVVAAPAGAAGPGVTASFSLGSLVVLGDANPNSIVISRDAAGAILVNGGAVPVTGGTPTVANTTTIIINGGAGNDTIALNEASGARPRAGLVGGEGNDVLTGGSAADILAGVGGNDTLLGKGAADFLAGGIGNDVLTGGDADDQVLGEDGDDTMIWNPGDDT